MKTLKPVLGFSLLLLSFAVHSQTEINERTGYARDIDTDELIYTEEHYETFLNGNIISDKVTYRDADGNVIAEKDVDYTHNATMPDFKLENFATGHQESASRQDTELEVTFAAHDEAEKKTKLIPLPEQGIIDAGFDRFIIQHWDELISGKRLVRKMLVPSMKQFIDFRIYQDGVEQEKGKRIFKVETDSFLFRFLTDPLVLQYDMDKPRLYTYRGTSNMRDEKGDNLQVRITFPGEQYKVTRK